MSICLRNILNFLRWASDCFLARACRKPGGAKRIAQPSHALSSMHSVARILSPEKRHSAARYRETPAICRELACQTKV
jgi:predicted transcriptional regulator